VGNEGRCPLSAVSEVEPRLGSHGRVLLRPSGSEALVRVMEMGSKRTLVRETSCVLATTVEQAMRTCWTESRRCFADAELLSHGRDSEFQPRGWRRCHGRIGSRLARDGSCTDLKRITSRIVREQVCCYPSPQVG